VKRPALFALALLLGCPGPTAEELLAKFEKNPADADTGAHLAMLGRPMSDGLLKLMEKNAADPKFQQGASAVLAVAGDACMVPCIEYIDMGGSDDVKRRILLIMGKGKWRSALNKFVNRLDHSVVGHDIYVCLSQILEGQTIPENPWAAENEERMRRFAEWHQWRGRNAPILPDMRESRYERGQFDAVKAAVQGELKNPFWQ
jgi:hypothetical protein